MAKANIMGCFYPPPSLKRGVTLTRIYNMNKIVKNKPCGMPDLIPYCPNRGEKGIEPVEGINLE